MKNNPIGSLKRGFYSLLTAGAIAFTGCGDKLVEPPVNHAPQNTLNVISVPPTSIRVQYNCTDQDGLDDITDSYVVINSDTIRTKSLDSTFVMQPGTHIINSYCTDKAGAKTTAGPLYAVIQPPQQPTQSFTQSATVPADSLKTDYNATAMENLDSAKVRVQRDGALVDSMLIKKSQIPFTKTYNIPGSYMFISDIPGLKPDTATAAVKDYDAAPNFSTIPADSLSMNEGGGMSINLESKIINSEPNPGDNPVTIDDAVPTDGKTKVTKNGYDLRLSPVADSTGAYKVNIVLKNSRGKTTTKILQGGQIYDLPHLIGTIESGKNLGVGAQSTIIAYRVNGNDTLRLQTTNSNADTMNLTDANGNFDFKINKRSADLEKIILMARLGTPGNYLGPVRVIDAPSRDSSGILISPTPYPNGINFNDFVKYMYEITQADSTFWPARIRMDFRGEYIPGFDGLKKIRVLDHGYFGDSTTTITLGQQNNIKNKVNERGDIAGTVGSYADYLINSVQKVFGNDTTDYTVSAVSPSDPLYPFIGNWKITPKPGVVVVAPKTNMPYAGFTIPQKTGASLISGGVIYLKSADNEGIVSHEFGRMFLGLGNNTTLDPSQTVMWASPQITTTGPADKDAGWILYNPTYMTTLPQFGFVSLDMLGKILRRDFK